MVQAVIVAVGSMLAALLALHAILNGLLLRRPAPARVIAESVAVLVPCRNEQGEIPGLVASLLSLRNLEQVQILLLDDHSTDQTRALIEAAIRDHPQAELLHGADLAEGWKGKTYACQQLAERVPHADVLVFVDADVRLEPDAVTQAVATLRDLDLALVSPYPRQVSQTWSERLAQPLLQWSWLATLPLRWAERSTRRSLTAANGQFLVVDAAAYRHSGGHAAIRGEVLDDIRLLQNLKAHGYRGGVIDGSAIATCRMYSSWSDLRSGYSKWLWSAFGSPAATAMVAIVLTLAFLIPPLAALSGSVIGAIGYLAAVVGRMVAAVRSGDRLRDAFLHPLSILLLITLMAWSWIGHARGSLTWKERTVS